MRSRDNIQQTFVTRFHSGERSNPVSLKQLNEVEIELNTKLPTAFRAFMTLYGTVFTPSILSQIVDAGLEHPDVQNFLEPHEAIEGTRGYWAAGMPDDVIGVASDCMGHMIGFWRQAIAADDAPTVFFDHDFVETYELAPSFDEFPSWYLDHLKGQSTSDI